MLMYDYVCKKNKISIEFGSRKLLCSILNIKRLKSEIIVLNLYAAK